MNISISENFSPVNKRKIKKNKPSSDDQHVQLSDVSTDDPLSHQSDRSRLHRNSMCQLMRTKTRDPIQILSSCTCFTRREIKMIYRNFKQDCPDGLITVDILREIYARFYPFGNPSAYAVQVFRTLDMDRSGAVTFKEFLIWLSTVSRGSQIDKLNWIFNLYDINNDGKISKDELNIIIRSVYQLMGDQIHCNLTTKRLMSDSQFNDIFTFKVLKFFTKFDPTCSGFISHEDFIRIATADKSINCSLENFHTVI